MSRTMVYIAFDGERLEFDVPKGVNRHLVAKAIKAIHKGADPDMAARGLTESERDLLLEIIGGLEEHKVPAAV